MVKLALFLSLYLISLCVNTSYPHRGHAAVSVAGFGMWEEYYSYNDSCQRWSTFRRTLSWHVAETTRNVMAYVWETLLCRCVCKFAKGSC